MRKQRFSLFRKQRFSVTRQGQADIAQRKPHHTAAGGVRTDQAAQTGLRVHNGMPCLPGQLVTAAVTAGHRIADTSGRHKGGVGTNRLAFFGNSSAADAVLHQQLFGTSPHKFRILRVRTQRRQYIGGTVTLRENPASALGFERYTERFKQFHGLRRRECIQTGIQEPAVMTHKGQKLPHVAVAGHIAASLAGNQQFLARSLGVMFQHGDPQSPGTGRPCGHQTGGTAPNNQKIGHAACSFRLNGQPNADADANAYSSNSG